MRTTINGQIYLFYYSSCGEAVAICRPLEDGLLSLVTKIPLEKNWQDTAHATIIAIQAIEKARKAKPIIARHAESLLAA